ncbi:MAG: hypothetical protein K8S56_09275 [Candidatus Cloacimonetes bacterium]|nr:hypothetical protein [Candidatus Cloacimonadota bacterium]
MNERIFPFSGGTQNAVNVPNRGALLECINYDNSGDELSKRSDPSTWQSSLNSQLLSDEIDLIDMSDPYYATNLPADIHPDFDFVLIFYGRGLGGFYMYLAYKKDTSVWDITSLEVLSDLGVTYTAMSAPRFMISNSRVLVTDGVNTPHLIQINKDGNLEVMLLDMPTPQSIAELKTTEEYNKFVDADTTDDTGMGIERSMIKGMCYTIELDGNESNTSPIAFFT